MNLQRSVSVLRRGYELTVRYRNMKTARQVSSVALNEKRDKKRSVSTYEIATAPKEESLIVRILTKIPFLQFERERLRIVACVLYEKIADQVDYVAFFEKFDLPDTFFSWFIVTELHLWMMSVRMMAEGDKGKVVRNAMFEAFWLDVAARTKQLGAASPKIMRQQINECSEQLQAVIIAYDEGLECDDTVLASAIWRRFYRMEHVELPHLEMLVRYVRKHVMLLDAVPTDQLFTREAPINWEPISLY
ncbi:ubiquinol-cytochrome-c reductase complex assembly factor 1 [Cylas formicarius]|uniref:ubiquinol-cytochrome-c reductase complex assembly factor 1 n=1 Tax=Cylas formicarius TaxID=197179 RepID=UPI0029589598|nr:ubiquinol-cytochrome-c reductase complex assembly factor 1 [Cylas formicarius]